MIVADTNVIAYRVLVGERTVQARSAWEKDGDWVAPPLWRNEFLNVLTLHIRKRLITMADGLQALELAEEVVTELELPASPQLVLSLACSSGCTAYDCEFVAVARQLGVPLVTTDRQVLAAFPETAVALETFAQG